jgi:hypothetical protein
MSASSEKPYRLEIPLSWRQVQALDQILDCAKERMDEIAREAEQERYNSDCDLLDPDTADRAEEAKTAREDMKQAMPLWSALKVWVHGATELAIKWGDHKPVEEPENGEDDAMMTRTRMPISLDKTAYPIPVKIDVEAITWNACGPEHDRTAKLITEVVIGGTSHHLEAYAVVENEILDDSVPTHTARELGYAPTRTEQVLQVSSDVIDVGDLEQCFPGDGAFETVEIEGRSYILFLSPYRT